MNNINPRILLIEDEEDIVDFVTWELVNEGYVVQTADNGITGFELATSENWDVILLDLMLPGLDGIELCRKIRETHDTPIIMLTARSHVSDRISGLDAGADDYLSKPFFVDELFARIRVVLRRQLRQYGEVIAAHDLIVDVTSMEVTRCGQGISLTPREFRLLEFMVRNANIVLSREKILDNVWGRDFTTDANVVDVYVRYLRQKIDLPFDSALIQTVRGVGYALKGDSGK